MNVENRKTLKNINMAGVEKFECILNHYVSTSSFDVLHKPLSNEIPSNKNELTSFF